MLCPKERTPALVRKKGDMVPILSGQSGFPQVSSPYQTSYPARLLLNAAEVRQVAVSRSEFGLMKCPSSCEPF